MCINNITPSDVECELSFKNYIPVIQDILNRAKTIVIYNCDFEIGFLRKYNINIHIPKFIDCMELFAKEYGVWNEYYQNYTWQSLETAAEYYEYDFDNMEHNSLADVFATKYIYEKIRNNQK